MALQVLEDSVRTRLQSGVAITSMAQCVDELVENCIDAGATCIAVRIDLNRYKIQVVDNGKGISSDDLKLVGERYATSKCHTLEDLENLEYFGYRGEALASIVDVSGTVEVCSRHALSRQTYSKVFHNGKSVGVSLNRNHRPSVGTTVTVHDFFYNLPVRRKGISGVLELERVRKVVECIALVNPKISFSVRNDNVGECVLQTHKSQSVLNSFRHIFGSEKALAMKEVSIVDSCFKISGFISTEGHHSKALQFVYINGRVVKNSLLHGCVNSLLANSMMTKKLSRQSETKCQSKEYSGGKDFLSPKRTPEKYGMFVLMIECPRCEYDICLDPAKTLVEFKRWDDVLSSLECLVKKFLVDNNLALGPVAFGTNNLNEGSTETVRAVQSSSHSSTQPSPNVVQLPCISKFSTETVTYDIDFPGAIQSRTVRRQNTTRHKRSQQATVPTQSSEPKAAVDVCTPLLATSASDRHRPLVPLPGYNSDITHKDGSCAVGCDHLDLQSVDCLQSMDPGTCLHVGDSFCETKDQRILKPYPLQHCSLSANEAHQSILMPVSQISCGQSHLQQHAQVSQSAFSHEPVLASQQDTDDHVNSTNYKNSVSTSIARSSLGVAVHNVGREIPSKPLLGLNAPLRSPLQSSNLSSKLAKLIHKGKSTQISQRKSRKNASAFMPTEKCGVTPLTKTLLTPGKPLWDCTHVCACTTQSCFDSTVRSCSGNPTNTTTETFSFHSAHQLQALNVSHLPGTSQGFPKSLSIQAIDFNVKRQTQNSCCIPATANHSINCNVSNSRSSLSYLPTDDGDHIPTPKHVAKSSSGVKSQWGLHDWSRSHAHYQSYLSNENLTESVSHTQAFVPNTSVNCQLHEPFQPSHQEGYPWNHPPTNTTVLVTTSVPHLGTETHSVLAAKEDTAHTDTIPSIGCDSSRLTNFHHQPNLINNTSAVCSSGMQLSDTIPSQLSWPGQQAEMCSSDTFSHRPTSHFNHPDHPVSHIDQTISHVDHLTSYVHQPMSYADQPATHAAKPMSYVDQPTSHVDQPTSHVDQPTSHVDQPTLHVNQLVSNVDQPICAHIDQPMLYDRQPILHDDHSIDQPLACLKDSDFNKHSRGLRMRATPVELLESRRFSFDHQQPELTQLHIFPPTMSGYSCNQPHQILPTCDSLNVHSRSTTDDSGAEDLHTVGSCPKWKEVTNPATRQTVYIHTATGKCTTQKPATFMETSTLCVPAESMYKQVSLGTHIPDNCGSCSSDEAHPNPRTLKAKPLRAAPHLSHDFEAFLPRPKHQRVLSADLSSKPSSSQSATTVDSPGSSILSLLADTKQCGSESGSKWRHECELEQLELMKGSRDGIHSVAGMLEGWENPTFQAGHEDILNIGYSGCLRGQIRVHSVINHYKFSLSMFQNVKVLGQVDSKFIACLMDLNSSGTHNLLVLIDQHAAHERVRLEVLTADLWEDSIPSSSSSASLAALPPTTHPRIKSSLVHPPILVSLQPSERRLAKLFQKQLEAVGVVLVFRGDAVLVSSLPSVLVQREVSEVRRGRPTVALDILQEMIVKHLELLQTTSGGCSTLPSAISNVLNSQACHGAIKFGDPLSLEECEVLVQSLARCKLPFQCAHGRPALMPILDLDILSRRYPTQEVRLPDLKKLTYEI